jgi:hypothetical protein
MRALAFVWTTGTPGEQEWSAGQGKTMKWMTLEVASELGTEVPSPIAEESLAVDATKGKRRRSHCNPPLRALRRLHSRE